jgi:hypothetical protein
VLAARREGHQPGLLHRLGGQLPLQLLLLCSLLHACLILLLFFFCQNHWWHEVAIARDTIKRLVWKANFLWIIRIFGDFYTNLGISHRGSPHAFYGRKQRAFWCTCVLNWTLTCLSVAHLINILSVHLIFEPQRGVSVHFVLLEIANFFSKSNIFFLNFSEQLNELYGIYWPQRVLVIRSKYSWGHRYWSTTLVFPFGFLGLSLSLTRERDHTCPR